MRRETHPYRSRRSDASRFFRIARNSMLAVGILGILPPVLHPANTLRFLTGSTDCSQSGTFGALRDTDFDSVAIATGGIYIDESGLSQPNVFTARRERAAAYWLVDQIRSGRPLPDIWLLNGQTDGNDRFVERDYLKQLVWEYSDKTIAIPDDKFTLDSAPNTSVSVDHFAADFSARGRQKAALFTDNSHSKRFGMLTCARGVPARVFSAEDVLIEHRPDLAGILGKSMDSPYMRQKNDREFAKRLTLLWFPHGEFLTHAKEYVVSHPDSVITRVLSPPISSDKGPSEPAEAPADTSE